MEQLRDDFGTREDLVVYRLQTSKSNLKSARILLDAEEIRHASDYDDFYIASKEETRQLVENTKYIVDKIERYMISRKEEEA